MENFSGLKKLLFSINMILLALIFIGLMFEMFFKHDQRIVLFNGLLTMSWIVLAGILGFRTIRRLERSLNEKEKEFEGLKEDITQRITAEKKLEELKDRLELEKMKLEQVLNFEEDLNNVVNLNKLIDSVAFNTARILGAERCSLMLWDEDAQVLCLKAHIGLPQDSAIVQQRIRMGESLAGMVAENGVPLIVTDIDKDRRFKKKKRDGYKSGSFMIAPIKLDEKLMGVICVSDKKETRDPVFTELDLKVLCKIIRHFAITIDNTRLYRELEHLTIEDPLTHVYNYRQFAKKLDDEIRRMKRFSGALCLVMMDVDNFKIYNDEFGHAEGDKVLKEIGHRLKEVLRDTDIICRYAGDAFVVILPETYIHEARSVVDKIKESVDNLPLPRRITVSVGIAQATSGMNRYDLVLKSNTALFEAKQRGGNEIHVCA